MMMSPNEYKSEGSEVVGIAHATIDENCEGYNSDYIVRFVSGESREFLRTEDFIDYFRERIEKIKDVSDEVISSLRAKLDYNSYYTAYLLHQLSEDDFNKIAEEYAITLSTEISDDLIENIKILFTISSQDFSPSEISDIFKVEEAVIEQALQDLKMSGHID